MNIFAKKRGPEPLPNIMLKAAQKFKFKVLFAAVYDALVALARGEV